MSTTSEPLEFPLEPAAFQRAVLGILKRIHSDVSCNRAILEDFIVQPAEAAQKNTPESSPSATTVPRSE